MQYQETQVYEYCATCDGPCEMRMPREDVDDAITSVQLGSDPRELLKLQIASQTLD